MKVRIKQDPIVPECWDVQTRAWVLFWPIWEYKKSFYGKDAKEQALACAMRYAYPEIIEVTK